ncbi:MAG TPA: HEAT repeat domain-containing protein, partial [Candidatus Angelobacter sp.]|nr:HEAT repeat domain-containing protein [Candidatus Angelobacter sp.]
ANLGFTDNFTSSLTHYPAMGAVTMIGEAAIPKLELVLTKDAEPNIRRLAAWCISYIGGSRAKRALVKALPHENDPCLKKFLRISLELFANKKEPNHIPSENGEWWSAFYCSTE